LQLLQTKLQEWLAYRQLAQPLAMQSLGVEIAREIINLNGVASQDGSELFFGSRGLE
jgi:hypothetical protein